MVVERASRTSLKEDGAVLVPGGRTGPRTPLGQLTSLPPCPSRGSVQQMRWEISAFQG